MVDAGGGDRSWIGVPDDLGTPMVSELETTAHSLCYSGRV